MSFEVECVLLILVSMTDHSTNTRPRGWIGLVTFRHTLAQVPRNVKTQPYEIAARSIWYSSCTVRAASVGFLSSLDMLNATVQGTVFKNM